jgi:peptidoglycan hydrolase CwlO-like protein
VPQKRLAAQSLTLSGTCALTTKEDGEMTRVLLILFVAILSAIIGYIYGDRHTQACEKKINDYIVQIKQLQHDKETIIKEAKERQKKLVQEHEAVVDQEEKRYAQLQTKLQNTQANAQTAIAHYKEKEQSLMANEQLLLKKVQTLQSKPKLTEKEQKELARLREAVAQQKKEIASLHEQSSGLQCLNQKIPYDIIKERIRP